MTQDEIIRMARQSGLGWVAHKRLERFAALVAAHEREKQAEQEPVGVVEGSGEWGIAGVLVAGVPIGTKLYAAPVRTKDLTDEEIDRALDAANVPELPAGYESIELEIARAAIAADRSKNGII